jgi:hypothetical protein
VSDLEIVVLKLVTGEEVVGERIPTTLPVIKLKNILKFDVVQVQLGQLSPTVRPWLLSDPKFEHGFKPEEVFAEILNPQVFVRDMYNATFSPIQLVR